MWWSGRLVGRGWGDGGLFSGRDPGATEMNWVTPTGEHGQGMSFLEAMLDAFPETRGQLPRLRTG